MEGAGPGLADLTSRPILPFQCPPCVHGARESNVSEERVCWVGWTGPGSGRGLEVGLAASWFRTRGSLCTFTLSACPPPRAGLDPHPQSHRARAPPGWNGAGVAAGRIRALGADPSLALPTRTQACSPWKASHVILEAEKGNGWLRVAQPSMAPQTTCWLRASPPIPL